MEGTNEGNMLGATVGMTLGPLEGTDEGDPLGTIVGVFDVIGSDVGSNFVNSMYKFDLSIINSAGKLLMLGSTASIFLLDTPNHSAIGFHTASQGVVGINRPLPILCGPSSVKSDGN